MYIKYNEKIISHSGSMFNGVTGDVDKNYNSLANNTTLESCNVASFSKLDATKYNRTCKFHTVLEDEECVIITVDSQGSLIPVGLLFRAKNIMKYMIKTALGGKSTSLMKYISTVLPYTLFDAGGSTYVNNAYFYHYDPSVVSLIEAGETNDAYALLGGDSHTTAYDWYDDTTALEDYLIFPMIENGNLVVSSDQATFDFCFSTDDVSNIEGIYNASNVIRINEF